MLLEESLRLDSRLVTSKIKRRKTFLGTGYRMSYSCLTKKQRYHPGRFHLPALSLPSHPFGSSLPEEPIHVHLVPSIQLIPSRGAHPCPFHPLSSSPPEEFVHIHLSSIHSVHSFQRSPSMPVSFPSTQLIPFRRIHPCPSQSFCNYHTRIVETNHVRAA